MPTQLRRRLYYSFNRKTKIARITLNSLAGIGYAGAAGSSADCCTAVLQLLFYGRRITSAMILTNDHRHCLLLTVGEGDFIAVKSGFASGYAGEGPRTLSFVLEMLQAYAIDIDEFGVDGNVLDRLDASALTRVDVEELNAMRPIRPSRWYDYIFDHSDTRPKGMLIDEIDPRISLGLVDPRIIDLAIHFEDEPDNRLLVGYRRLEDLVRTRSGLEKEFGAKLFQAAFGGEGSTLHWGRNRWRRAAGSGVVVHRYLHGAPQSSRPSGESARASPAGARIHAPQSSVRLGVFGVYTVGCDPVVELL